jgi:putative ABC transport system permease protein
MVRCCIAIAFICATVVVGAQRDDRASGSNVSAMAAVPSILVSRQLLESQGLSPGDIVSLSTEASGANPRQFRIVAGYEPVPDPMRLGAVRHEVRMHLPDLIGMTSTGDDPQSTESVDAINVGLKDPSAARAFARGLEARLPGIGVHSTTADAERAAPFIVLERFHLAIAIVTVIASSIFLLALMLMLVDERRTTVGILRLIGFRRRRILTYVFAEGLVIAAAGAVAGIVLAAAFQGGVNAFFQWRYDTALVFVRVTPRIALRSMAMAVPLGVLAAVASSWTLIRRDVFSLTRR